MHVIKWPMFRVAGRVSVRVQQLDVDCVCKSLDHVFLNVSVSIQFQANIHELFQSFYSLSSPRRQLISHTLDVLRSTLPKMHLDDIFASQESIALDLHRSLNRHMNQYGFTIQYVLLTRIHPNDDHVRQSMNEIEASKRMKEAMPHKAEAIKVECVKKAEASAERAYLHGVGIARQRREIARGMIETMKSLNESYDDSTISAKATMDLLLLTQYLDVLTAVGGSSKRVVDKSSSDGGNDGDSPSTSSLLLSHMPDTVFQIQDALSKQFVAATNPVKVENLLEMV